MKRENNFFTGCFFTDLNEEFQILNRQTVKEIFFQKIDFFLNFQYSLLDF